MESETKLIVDIGTLSPTHIRDLSFLCSRLVMISLIIPDCLLRHNHVITDEIVIKS